MTIYLLTMDYKSSVDGTVTTLYFGSAGYQSHPSDTPANQYFDPRLEVPFNFERSLFASGFGASSSGSFGLAVLLNPDGVLDYLLDHAVDGRAVTLLKGEPGMPLSSFTTMFTGVMGPPEFSWDRVTLRLRDRTEELSKEIQTSVYGGTNVAPNGVDGTANEKDKTKPLAYGKCLNITPVLVNQQKVIYQVHDGRIQAVDAVYSNGVALTLDTSVGTNGDVATTALLESAAPAAGKFCTCLAAGMFKLGAYTDTQITADVRGDATGGTYVSTVGGISQRIVTTRAGMTTADVNLQSIADLNTANSAEVGIFIPCGEAPRISEVLDQLSISIHAAWWFSRLGKFTMWRLALPSQGATPVATITHDMILADIERRLPYDLGDGVAVWRVLMNFEKNWTTQDEKTLAGVLSSTDAGKARQAWCKEEYRSTKTEDTAVQTLHPLAPEYSVDTCLTTKADADAEASRILTILKGRLDKLVLGIAMEVAPTVNLGDTVSIKIPRLGMDSGKNMAVVGLKEDLEQGRITLEVWG